MRSGKFCTAVRITLSRVQARHDSFAFYMIFLLAVEDLTKMLSSASLRITNRNHLTVCTNEKDMEAKTDPVLRLNINDLVFELIGGCTHSPQR